MDNEALPSAIADGEKALALTPGEPTLRALVEKLKIEQRAWEQSKQQAAIARAQFEKDSEVYALTFLVGIAVIFTQSPEPPDPLKRSYLDDLRTKRFFFPECRRINVLCSCLGNEECFPAEFSDLHRSVVADI